VTGEKRDALDGVKDGLLENPRACRFDPKVLTCKGAEAPDCLTRPQVAPKAADGMPDLSGIWRARAGGYALDVTSDLKPDEIQPWARALYQQRQENFARDSPALHCLPTFGPAVSSWMYKILQTPTVIAFLPEAYPLPSAFRQILLDGRALPKDLNPTWQGYSVGHWEGDALVVESAGFNDKTWLDLGGHPHSADLHMTERFRRRAFGHMQLQTTFNDPTVYARP
jgi:hypothetical protein